MSGDLKLGGPFVEKMTDDSKSSWDLAYRDQRPEISLLGLFSYDRFSIVLREKGWILPIKLVNW